MESRNNINRTKQQTQTQKSEITGKQHRKTEKTKKHRKTTPENKTQKTTDRNKP